MPNLIDRIESQGYVGEGAALNVNLIDRIESMCMSPPDLMRLEAILRI